MIDVGPLGGWNLALNKATDIYDCLSRSDDFEVSVPGMCVCCELIVAPVCHAVASAALVLSLRWGPHSLISDTEKSESLCSKLLSLRRELCTEVVS